MGGREIRSRTQKEGENDEKLRRLRHDPQSSFPSFPPVKKGVWRIPTDRAARADWPDELCGASRYRKTKPEAEYCGG